MTNTLQDARDFLKQVFGYDDFIGKQAEVVSQILNGGSALALMPTGGGKSLCYQLPALLREGTTIVVSPLIALMKDQVDQLAQYNIRAAYLNSSLTPKEAYQVREKLLAGKLDLLYIAPERLIGGDGMSLLQQTPIALIAIDEAHCISQWGHDFRPEYLQLGELATALPDVPRLALTATADALTRQEIIEKLHLKDGKITIASFDRSNIRYHVQPKQDTREQFLRFYRREHDGQPGIVYCLTRKRSEETAEWLSQHGIKAVPYHAGMENKERQKNQERFLREDGVVVCATVAFGMGINKPDVRFVAHFDLPKSIEGYYQETGRAGRDGLPANAILFFSQSDAFNIRKMIDGSDAPEEVRRISHNKLNALLLFCDAITCRREQLLNYFDESYTPPCKNCDNCLTPPEMRDGTVQVQKLLSAARRTEEKFGAGHLIDILLGKNTEKVTKFKHNKLPTFGVGNDFPAAQWQRIVQQLISQGIFKRDEEFGSLKITPSGDEVLRGKRKVQIKKEAKRETTRRDKRTARAQPDSQLDGLQLQVFNALRDERKRLAEAQNIPAYVIFHDTVLMELARTMPDNKIAFAHIPGTGAVKVERYADHFLKILENFR